MFFLHLYLHAFFEQFVKLSIYIIFAFVRIMPLSQYRVAFFNLCPVQQLFFPGFVNMPKLCLFSLDHRFINATLDWRREILICGST